MNGDLSHGLPPLFVSGNRIARSDTGAPLVLRGVNRSGLEYTEPGEGGFLAAASFNEDEVREIVGGWGARVIRVPFNQDWALHGRAGHTAGTYLNALDQVIGWAARFGAYTLLDLQWLDADTEYGHTEGRVNRVAPAPNPETILLWGTLAARYKDEPAVLFDLFNEPHDPLDDDFRPIYIVGDDGNAVESSEDFVDEDVWNPWAERLVAEIRRVHPESLIFVGGVDWAFDLRMVRVDARNIVYSAHVYPNRKPRSWRKAFGRAAEVPVFAGEWGGGDGDLDFGRGLIGVLESQCAGWTAWSWVDDPPLIQAPRVPGFRPTKFGELVRDTLRAA